MVLAELGLNRLVDAVSEAGYVGVVHSCRRNWLMYDNVCGTLVEEFRSGWPDLPGSVDGDRDHGQTCRYRHAKSTFLEGVQVTVAATGALSEHDKGVAVLLRTCHPFVDSVVGPLPRTPINLDHPSSMQGLGEHRDLVELLLCQVSDWGWDRPKQQRNVKVGEMVRKEEVLRVSFDVFGAGDFVAHWRNQQERDAPQLEDGLAESAQAERHGEKKGCRDDNRE